jgi:hypothetical protein
MICMPFTKRFFHSAAWGRLAAMGLFTGAGTVLVVAVLAADQPSTKADPVTVPHLSGEVTPWVQQVLDLIDSLNKFDQAGRDPNHKLGFELPEKAINEYLAYSLHKKPRPGLGAVAVTFLSQNEVSVAFEVDFDSLGPWTVQKIPDQLRPVLTGKPAMRMTLQFDASNGLVNTTFKGGVGPDGSPLPPAIGFSLLQALELRQPEAADASKPYPLPYGLKRVWINKHSICGET